jgi:hypothetical protein
MGEALDDEQRASENMHQQLRAELTRLDTQEENLLDLVADGQMTSPKAKARLTHIHQTGTGASTARHHLPGFGSRCGSLGISTDPA